MAGSARISSRTLSLVVALVAGLVLLGVSAVMADPLTERRTDVDARVDELELLRIRTELARVHRDQLTNTLLSPLIDSPPSAPGPERIAEVVETAIADLETLAADANATGFAAGSLRAVLTEWTNFPTVPEDELWDLMFFTDMARYEGVQPAPVETIEQILFYDADVAEVLHEMAALQLEVVGTDDPLLADLIESISPNAFAADFVDPNATSEFGGPALEADLDFYGWELSAGPAATVLHAELVAMIESTAVADYYRHLELALATGSVHTPAEFDAYATELLGLIDGIRARVDVELATQSDAVLTDSSAVAQRSALVTWLRIVGFGLLAIACLASLVGLIRRGRTATRQLSIDPLTGIGNRRTLELTERNLDDPHHRYHLIAVIDLDRFKLVNDTHGHAIGDELLVLVAQGLQQIADDARCDASTVVRQGGDEFLLSLHSSLPIDRAALGVRLDELRASRVSISQGESLDLSFSYGVVAADGNPDMASLVRSADLAAYEDKAHRRTDESVTDLRQPVDMHHSDVDRPAA